MEGVAVKVRRVEPGGVPPGAGVDVEGLERDLKRARTLAWLLDANFSIGRIRFGWDAIIGGLIPAVGDTLTALAGSYLVYVAWKHKLGGVVIASMIGNLVFDWLIGLIPALGDVLDVAFKAHLRNLRILEKAIARRRGESTFDGGIYGNPPTNP